MTLRPPSRKKARHSFDSNRQGGRFGSARGGGQPLASVVPLRLWRRNLDPPGGKGKKFECPPLQNTRRDSAQALGILNDKPVRTCAFRDWQNARSWRAR